MIAINIVKARAIAAQAAKAVQAAEQRAALLNTIDRAQTLDELKTAMNAAQTPKPTEGNGEQK